MSRTFSYLAAPCVGAELSATELGGDEAITVVPGCLHYTWHAITASHRVRSDARGDAEANRFSFTARHAPTGQRGKPKKMGKAWENSHAAYAALCLFAAQLSVSSTSRCSSLRTTQV